MRRDLSLREEPRCNIHPSTPPPVLQVTAAVQGEARRRAAARDRGGRGRSTRTTPPLNGSQRRPALQRPTSRPTSRPMSSGPSPAASPQQRPRRARPSPPSAPPSPLWGAVRGLMPPGLTEADWSPISSRFSSSNGPSPACVPGTPGPNKACDHTRATSSHHARADAPIHASLPSRTASDDVPGCSPAQACGTVDVSPLPR